MKKPLVRFDMAKDPIRTRWFLKPITALLSYPAVLSHKNIVHRHGTEGLKPPYLLLCNHNAFMDFKVATKVIYPDRANYVVAIDGFIGREWLLRNVGCICKRKFTNDATLVRQLRKVLDNGDIAVVQRVRNIHELYGFRFAEVTMTFPDYDDYELTAITMLDTLTTEAPALTREQQEQLYNQVMEDYMDVPYKSERLKKLKDDKYYNALQIKFAYAATCHKAQGGQWAHVYIDQGYMTDDMLSPDYFHWLYTALTRATEQVYLVNWPKTQVDGHTDSY